MQSVEGKNYESDNINYTTMMWQKSRRNDSH